MGIFDLFKKLVKESKVEEEVVSENLAFSEIEGWIKGKLGENELKEKEIVYGFGGQIEGFIKELKEKIVALESFDVEAKREKDEIKNIVVESRSKYIESVEYLIERLNNLEEPKLDKFIEKINKIFLDFNKGSYKNYEKATILIGKEMASIRDSVRAFSENILKTYEGNKGVVSSFKTLSQIKLKYQNIPSIDNSLNMIIEKKLVLDKKLSEKQEETRLLNENVEEIKKSQNHLDFLANQEKIESLKSESKQNILELKQLLDFKALADFFHIFPEQMNVVKNHKEDFYKYFIRDNGKSIISLLDTAKFNNDGIGEKIFQIHSKLEQARDCEQEIKKDQVEEIYSEIKEIELKINDLKMEKEKEEKRGIKLGANREELVGVLKGELGGFGVVVE